MQVLRIVIDAKCSAHHWIWLSFRECLHIIIVEVGCVEISIRIEDGNDAAENTIVMLFANSSTACRITPNATSVHTACSSSLSFTGINVSHLAVGIEFKDHIVLEVFALVIEES